MIFNYCYIFCAHVAIHQDNMVDARSPPPDEHGALHEMETEAPREERASTWALILGLNLSICLYIIFFGISSSYRPQSKMIQIIFPFRPQQSCSPGASGHLRPAEPANPPRHAAESAVESAAEPAAEPGAEPGAEPAAPSPTAAPGPEACSL